MPLQKPVKKKPKLPTQPKMYISDRPSKSKKAKKVNNPNGALRNSFGSTNNKIVQFNENKQRDTSKSKKSLSKKKKKSKDSLNSRSSNLTKSSLIQQSKFSSYEKGNSYEPSPASCNQHDEYINKDYLIQKSVETTDESSSKNDSKSDPKQSYFYRKHPNNVDIQETQTPDTCINCMRLSVCTENSELCTDCFNKQSSQSSRSSILSSTPNQFISSVKTNETNNQNEQHKEVVFDNNHYNEFIDKKPKLLEEESKLEDKSYIYNKTKNDSNSYINDYLKTKTPISESKGELLEEFITPDVNSESVHLTAQDIKEEQPSKTVIGWNEVEPELPSDSYFIMIFTDKNNINFDDHTNTGDIESSNDISNSESSTSKNLSVINSSSHHKKLFYCKPESCKQKKNQMVDCSQEEEEEEGIRFPQIASNPKVTSPYNIIEYMKKSMPEIRGNNFRSSSNGCMTTSVAHVCIEEARSEEEDETEKVITDSELHNSIEVLAKNNQSKFESSLDDVFEYSVQETINNLTNNKSIEFM